MKSNDELILEVLQGHKIAKWPSPKLIKIFISSNKKDFSVERRQLLENVGPDLQTRYDDRQFEVEFVDMHFGSPDSDTYDVSLLDDHLGEIRACHQSSRGCFFLLLLGNSYGPFILPETIGKSIFEKIGATCSQTGANWEIINKWFVCSGNNYKLRESKGVSPKEWQNISEKIVNAIFESLKGVDDYALDSLLLSTVEKQFISAAGLAPEAVENMVVIVRDFNGEDTQLPNETLKNIENYKKYKQYKLREKVCKLVPEDNLVFLTASSQIKDLSDDTVYLNSFKEMMKSKVSNLIGRSFETNPELVSKKKIVQENFQENLTHLTLCFQDLDGDEWHSDVLEKIAQTVKECYAKESQHDCILIHGNTSSGKTTLLRRIYQRVAECFDCKLIRIVRFSCVSPRAAYNLELLRTICQQICMALRLPEGFLPKDASFDPLYVNNWFQKLIKQFEEINHALVIMIDDIHLLNPLDSDVFPGLSWLPITLPNNVFIICTTGVSPDHLRLTPVQREKLRGAENVYNLPSVESCEAQVEQQFKAIECKFGYEAIAQLGALITCSEYGLTETEILEVLMPTNNSEMVISLETANYNFSTLCRVKRQLRPLIRDKLMSGKLLVEWSHHYVKEIARKKYLENQQVLRNTHTELVNLYYSEFFNEDNSDDSEAVEEIAPLPTDNKDTPFRSTLHSVVSFSVRHVEEAWIHLLKAGDVTKLKNFAICNFDFLLAVVQTVSISYLRCILEHARCFILDRDLELVYHTIRKSSDVITRDPLQLATQIISWLRQVADPEGGMLSAFVLSAMAWCDGFTLPLVVPLTGWLKPPLPMQSRTLSVPGVRLVEATPSGQHVVCSVENEPQLWHIMSNQLVHTFKGHSGKILCMTVTKQSQYLLTGSEDISIIVWDLKSLSLKLRIHEHIAPVLCVTSALNNSVVVSGGDDSSIIITSLSSGRLVMKIDHHRGPVTSVKVTSAEDVLVSSSQDKTVCLWSLENFTLLNKIELASPIRMIDVSADSVFLLAVCDDNVVYVRALTTGTELHTLIGHKSRVRSVCIACDSCRAVVGCADGRVYIYEIHSGKLAKMLSGQPGEISAVKITEKDDFLMTAGGNRIFFYPFRAEDNAEQAMKLSKKSHHLQPHVGPISCLDISRDGQFSVTASTDNWVNVWQLNSHELVSTLDGHSGSVSAVKFAPNGLFVASGSEDKSVKIWGLTMCSVVATFKGHQTAVCCVEILMDSARVLSSDKSGNLYVWLADNGNLVQSYNGPSKYVSIASNMKFLFCSDGGNALRIWSMYRDDEKYNISHAEEITCFVITWDSLNVITGSKDMSLKVWQTQGGKLSQVLVGHTDAVTCVAVAVMDKNVVVSGSKDANLIIWDINTGAELHTLSAHLSGVTCVKVSGDGTVAVSGSEDKSIILWDVKRGLQLTSLQLHVPVTNVKLSSDCSRIAVHLKESRYLPIVCLHNTPAKYVKLPTYCAPAKDIENPRPGPKRQMRRLLKKEVSLDTYTWQRKYGHLTSNIMIAAVDERLKRRFSVSASMEEISKIPQNKPLESQAGNASLAQSQHFDQLEALWNKRSPPRRKHNQSLSKQSSLVESRFGSSEENIPLEEVED